MLFNLFNRKSKEDKRIEEFVNNLIGKYSAGSTSLQMQKYTTRKQLELRKAAVCKRKIVQA